MKQELRVLQIKIGAKWVDALVIGDGPDGFFAVSCEKVPKTAIRMLKVELDK